MAPSPDFREATVLLADGSAFFRDIVSSMLTAFRVGSVLESSDEADAMKQLREGHVDCLITEWKLEPNDGLALITNIRHEAESPNPTLPIILCTGYTDLETVLKARDAGVNAVLAKPVSPMHLYRKLADAMFAEREFIDVPGYRGPCRRRRSVPFDGPDRRTTVTQEDIDHIFEQDQ